MTTPVAPYAVTPARTTEGPCWLINDANDQVVAAAFDEPMAQFVTAKLNHSCRRRTRPFVMNSMIASMLFAFRLHLESEMKAPVVAQELEIGPLMGDLCEWFGLDIGERAIALGPAILGYLDRLDQEDGDQMVSDQSVSDQLVSGQIHGVEADECLG